MNHDQNVNFLRVMLKIRKFESVIKDLYKEGFIEGAIHCYTGEEAIAAGVCEALRKDDTIFSTHRGHGHAIAKGCALKKILAELMGKSSGVSGGMGGSMHLFDIEHGLMGGNGIVGGGIPLSLGTAYAAKYKKTDQVTVCFFSEGASNQGTFHEALNMAALWKLPLVFVCENNLFAATTPSYKTLSHPDIAKRGEGYGIPGVIADGNDVWDVFHTAKQAVERARNGEGPTLIEYKTYRVEGHCMVLNDLPQHRPKTEVEGWAQRDPIELLVQKLSFDPVINQQTRTNINEELNKEFKEAIAFAKAAHKPDVDEFMSTAGKRYGLDV